MRIFTFLKKIFCMKKSFLLGAIVFLGAVAPLPCQAQDGDLVKVYRWYNAKDQNYVTVAENEFADDQMVGWGWKDKKLLFEAYRNPAPDRVAVNAWYNPETKDFASIAQDEFTDDQMIKMGYTNKKHQFYGGTRQHDNTVTVYRWYVRKNRDWVTVPEQGDTDSYIKKGYGRKTFQYYGIALGDETAEPLSKK